MKTFKRKNINTPVYWDSHQTAVDFGLRQQKYSELAGTGFSIVELGCGLSPFLSQANFKMKAGVDYSSETIFSAMKKYLDVEYYIADCTKTPFPVKSFDVSVAGEVIEHLEDPQALINEMVRITKHKIIISTPILEFDDPEHLHEFDEKDLKKLLSPYGKVTCETIKSDRFKGRKYIFALCEMEKQ